ncbi:MAG: hypothetical protein P4L81_01795 [Candidatus Pacebacteria bacterium]|nr:hypothetical protein [Candidatus Paceibacterota bacterium]
MKLFLCAVALVVSALATSASAAQWSCQRHFALCASKDSTLGNGGCRARLQQAKATGTWVNRLGESKPCKR